MRKKTIRISAEKGVPYPMGVSWDSDTQTYNFALFSKSAKSVSLLFFRDPDLAHAVCRVDLDYLVNKSGHTWHCRIAKRDLNGAQLYGYSIDGPIHGRYQRINAFDSEKVLLDVYAPAVQFPKDFQPVDSVGKGSNRGKGPLGILTACENHYYWTPYKRRDVQELVIYETHLKGFTANPNSGVSEEKRGTYRGLIEKIPYLQELGVTAVEFLPVFQREPNTNDYWGYNTLNFFSPHNEYAATRDQLHQHEEFQEMVDALHRANIDVILDVVYNHSCEGNQEGPTYSYKGIDNASYYILSDDPNDPYMNFSGTGNTMDAREPAVQKMVVDSLCFWVEEMGVDGFRFDLASIFSRNSDGTVNTSSPPIFEKINAIKALDGVFLIAEPWDLGTYQLGQAFPGIRWMQWNSKYRECLQRFVKGDEGAVGELMSRLYGSNGEFPDDISVTYHPYQSINYIVSHDGFTMYDLVSYNEKNNWRNGHKNTDGSRDFSWHCGHDGIDDIPDEVMLLRKRQVKNFCTLLMLSNGTPMLKAGDEFLQTQQGNNNPYNQDNESSWLDWSKLETNKDIFRFFKMMIAFRKSHPGISRHTFWREDVRWYGVDGSADISKESHCLAYYLAGRRQDDDDLYVMINAYWKPLPFKIQEFERHSWRRVIDTAKSSPQDILQPGHEILVKKNTYRLQPRSVVVLVGRA